MANEARQRSNIDTPGNAYKRNFNRNPTGKFGVRMARAKHSRSKSAR